MDKILTAKKDTSTGSMSSTAYTSEWEKEIEQLVYKLYDLTEEEIKIIEGGR